LQIVGESAQTPSLRKTSARGKKGPGGLPPPPPPQARWTSAFFCAPTPNLRSSQLRGWMGHERLHGRKRRDLGTPFSCRPTATNEPPRGCDCAAPVRRSPCADPKKLSVGGGGGANAPSVAFCPAAPTALSPCTRHYSRNEIEPNPPAHPRVLTARGFRHRRFCSSVLSECCPDATRISKIQMLASCSPACGSMHSDIETRFRLKAPERLGV